MELIVIAFLKVKPGKRELFDDFERQALALIQKHGGALLQAIQPTATLPPTDLPDEVHVLKFPSQQALDSYRADPELLKLAPLRAEAIGSTQILIGTSLHHLVAAP